MTKLIVVLLLAIFSSTQANQYSSVDNAEGVDKVMKAALDSCQQAGDITGWWSSEVFVVHIDHINTTLYRLEPALPNILWMDITRNENGSVIPVLPAMMRKRNLTTLEEKILPILYNMTNLINEKNTLVLQSGTSTLTFKPYEELRHISGMWSNGQYMLEIKRESRTSWKLTVNNVGWQIINQKINGELSLGRHGKYGYHHGGSPRTQAARQLFASITGIRNEGQNLVIISGQEEENVFKKWPEQISGSWSNSNTQVTITPDWRGKELELAHSQVSWQLNATFTTSKQKEVSLRLWQREDASWRFGDPSIKSPGCEGVSSEEQSRPTFWTQLTGMRRIKEYLVIDGAGGNIVDVFTRS